MGRHRERRIQSTARTPLKGRLRCPARQRNSGPSSSRQPPLVGGAPPLPRSFRKTPTRTPMTAIGRPRRRHFIGPTVGPPSGASVVRHMRLYPWAHQKIPASRTPAPAPGLSLQAVAAEEPTCVQKGCALARLLMGDISGGFLGSGILILWSSPRRRPRRCSRAQRDRLSRQAYVRRA